MGAKPTLNDGARNMDGTAREARARTRLRAGPHALPPRAPARRVVKPPRHLAARKLPTESRLAPYRKNRMFKLELVNVTKRYPGVRANDQVSLAVKPGEIHAVLGENGAGKSTLMKIVYGMVQPDSGDVRWNGAALVAHTPRAARARGIAMVFQHFSLFESMTVAQNVWLGLDRKISLGDVRDEISRVGNDYGIVLDPDRHAYDLSVGERQRVEVLRALLTKPSLLILDEPTSMLTPQAVATLFATLRKLAADGCSLLYVSHKLEEIRALCHSATVMRGGRVVAQLDPRRETTASLARAMLGGEPPKLERRPSAPRSASLVVAALELEKGHGARVSLRDVDFEVRAGEILGVAGVSGNGQQELLAALSGEASAPSKGSIRLGDEDITRLGPRARRKLGLRFVPEERLERASVPSLSLTKNTLLTRSECVSRTGFLQMRSLRALTRRLIGTFDVEARGPDSPASNLSGGNLQKFIVARELDAVPKVFIVAQPTWGVDIGASAQIRSRLIELRDGGAAVLVVSEDLDELFELSDALVVIAGGRLSPRMRAEDMTADRIGRWMSGLWSDTSNTAKAAPGAHIAPA
jgi:general nucleoside transport system ATP-binding protein